MSEKFNQRSIVYSPFDGKLVRTNSNSNHSKVQKHDKEPEVASSNLALVGSPAPRCHVRTSISTNSHAKPKVKSTQPLKVKENDKQSLSMSKLFQFADNPTKYVQRQYEDHLKLNLEFSDRSNESDNYYDSHDIAFGQNGEYRIPEYDHIRYLEFNKTETHDDSGSPKQHGAQDASLLEEHERLFISSDSTNDDRNNEEYEKESIPTLNRIAKRSALNRNCNSEPIKSTASNTFDTNYNKLRYSSDNLDCATKYKNTVNPMVKKYMSDTCQRASDVNYEALTDSLCDDSLLSKHFVRAIQLRSTDTSEEHSSQTSPETYRTILSGTSSNDGTWHQHSLNSSYFIPPDVDVVQNQNNSSTKDLSERVTREEEVQSKELLQVSKENDGSAAAEMYDNIFEDEAEQYLTVIKDNAINCENIHPYILMTDKAINVNTSVDHSQPFTTNHSVKLDEAGAYEFVSNRNNRAEETLTVDQILNISNVMLSDEGRNKENYDKLISNGSAHLYAENVFTDGTKLLISYDTSDLPDMQIAHNSLVSSTITENSSVLREQIYHDCDHTTIVTEKVKSDKKYDKQISDEANVFYMTVDEINAIVEYSNKLSEILKNVTERFKGPNTNALSAKTIDYNTFSNGIRSLSTPKLVQSCLQSPNFRINHSST